jgi:hypothetical protein
MHPLELKLDIGQFHQLPRHPAYKYEYFGGAAWLSPRPRFYHALLDLRALDPAGAAPPPDAALRPLRADDWEPLALVFAAAFRSQQPFGSLEDGPRVEAARKSLERTRGGGDGPCVEAACFVAEYEGRLAGAVLPTLLPAGDPSDWNSYYWPDKNPPQSIDNRTTRPHLTWIFVLPMLTGEGLGTALLHAAAGPLLGLGYTELASTFLLGNDSSMLWHWRTGFRLLPHRRWRRHVREPGENAEPKDLPAG